MADIVIPMNLAASAANPDFLRQLETASEASLRIEWDKLKNAFEKSRWYDIGFITLEDAAAIASLFIPQAAMARGVIKLVAAIVDTSVDTEESGQPFDIKTFIKGILIAEGIDWEALQKALKSGNPLLEAAVIIEDALILAAPFIPYGTTASLIISALSVFGQAIIYFIEQFGGTISDLFTSVGNTVGNVANDIGNSVADIANDIGDNVNSIVSDIGENL